MWKKTQSGLLMLVMAIPMLITMLYSLIARKRTAGSLMGTVPLRNKDRLKAQQQATSRGKSGPGGRYDPTPIAALPVSKTIGGPTHSLDFYDEEYEDEMTTAEQDGCDCERCTAGEKHNTKVAEHFWEPSRMPGTDWSRVWGTAYSSKSHDLPADKKTFIQGMADVTVVLQKATSLIADRHALPLEELYVCFDEWPFEEGTIGVKHSRYEDEVPCHSYYRVELDELFSTPEPKPTEPAVSDTGAATAIVKTMQEFASKLDTRGGVQRNFRFPPLSSDHSDVAEFLHNVQIRPAVDEQPPVQLAGVVIQFEPKDHYLAYYFTAQEWSADLSSKIESLVRAGVLTATPNFVDPLYRPNTMSYSEDAF